MLTPRDPRFERKVSNFPESAYRVSDPSTRLYKLMYALLEVGLGPLAGWIAEADASESLPTTKFNDLDAMYSFLRAVHRFPSESYPWNPYGALTGDQWAEVYAKDALFRNRISQFLQALLRGGTLEGIQMAAEAASGVDCQVIELWRVVSGQGLAAAAGFSRRPALNLAKEFAIVPLEPIDQEQRSAIIKMVDVLKPAASICTVHSGPVLPPYEVDVTFSASMDYNWEVRKMVTAPADYVAGPGDWLNPAEEVEAPTYAFLAAHDSSQDLNKVLMGVVAFQVDEQFRTTFATLVASINATQATIVVDEVDTPPIVPFLLRIDAEVMLVTDRTSVPGFEARYEYSVARGQEDPATGQDTTPAAHVSGAPVNSGAVAMPASTRDQDPRFGPWQAIPLADSPDNYPNGQFAGDQSRYDPQGKYVFSHASQAAFEEWFAQQIKLLGGEVTDGRYRLPSDFGSGSLTDPGPEAALARPTYTVSIAAYPDPYS